MYQGWRPSTLGPRWASEEVDEGGPVSALFKIFFGKKQEKPLGFDRIDETTNPESYRATT
jgi:hypothetical protein